MKILHTSDWHLGKKLYGKSRYAEFEAFLNWLITTLHTETIDVLLVAGDVFDTTTPSNRAQELYYHFLTRVAETGCRHVVIIAGNHDSPSFLEAPKTLLKILNVHVLGTPQGPEDVLTLYDRQHRPELVVAAVPYLRDRYIRKVQAGESLADKSQNLKAGIARYYHEMGEAAAIAASPTSPTSPTVTEGDRVPVVAMGHLFAAGGQTQADDGVRELYVGSLAHVDAGVFSAVFDYVALGHLHVPQKVAGQERIRYSGSPIAMGFGEAKQQKIVLIVDFSADQVLPQALPIPCFQPLLRVEGSLEEISAQLAQLPAEGTWLEIVYTGAELCEHLRDSVDDLLAGTAHTLLRLENKRLVQRMLMQTHQQDTLESLTPTEVFGRLLEVQQIPEAQQQALQATYQEILTYVLEAEGAE